MSNPVTPLNPQQTAMQEKKASAEGYLKRVLIGLDMFCNTLIGGKPDETMSSRWGRDAYKGDPGGEVASRLLDIFQTDHGAKAVAGDEARALNVEKTEESSGLINQ